jgi:hypothetical protein
MLSPWKSFLNCKAPVACTSKPSRLVFLPQSQNRKMGLPNKPVLVTKATVTSELRTQRASN